jgi:hypothetical protein
MLHFVALILPHLHYPLFKNLKRKSEPAQRRAGPNSRADSLRKEIPDGIGDTRDNRVVEDKRDSRQQKRAQNNGNDDADRVGNIKIAALIMDSGAGAKSQSGGPAFGFVKKLFHKIPPNNNLILALCGKEERSRTIWPSAPLTQNIFTYNLPSPRDGTK